MVYNVPQKVQDLVLANREPPSISSPKDFHSEKLYFSFYIFGFQILRFPDSWISRFPDGRPGGGVPTCALAGCVEAVRLWRLRACIHQRKASGKLRQAMDGRSGHQVYLFAARQVIK